MAREGITKQQIWEHVQRLGEQHPPVPMDSVDRTVNDPRAVVSRFAPVIDYLARVELEVDRNVLELLTLLPAVSEVDEFFYADVWQPQEIQHGLILDRLQTDIGLKASEPMLEVQMEMKVLGALAHLPAIQDIARLMYYLTGAATERQAVLAYNTLHKGLGEMGEKAIADTIIAPIKKQEPGHFAFYQMSATELVHSGELKPWQLFLTRTLRSWSYTLVGVNGKAAYRADVGSVLVHLDLSNQLGNYAREIGRLEARLLWAHKEGIEFPNYVLRALRDSVDAYAERLARQRPAVA